jgi:hypothetical protein
MIAGRNPFSKSTVPYATEKEFMQLLTLSSENIFDTSITEATRINKNKHGFTSNIWKTNFF